MTDNITVSRELLQRMVNAIDMLIPTLPGLNDKGRTWLRDEIIESTDALRAALQQPPKEKCAAVLAERIAPKAPMQEPEIDVRNIMLAVVPGFDGMGAEVYAKSTKDVEDKLSALGSELEEWQLGIRRLPAPVQEQQPAPASKPVLLQCLGCERVGTQEQLSASTDCDCWLHTQPAPVQEQQPAPVQEPDAFLHDDGYWTAAKTDAGRALNDRLRFAVATKVAVYTAPQPDRIAQLEAANTNLFEQGQKMHKRIQELEMDCKIGAQEMVKAYEEIDNLKAQVSWQKPVAWCQLGLGGKSIAYFDGKPMIMTGHVGNQHHPTPLFTAQPQRFAGKAVKLSEDEIQAAWASDNEWMRSLRNVESAVWAKLGVTE